MESSRPPGVRYARDVGPGDSGVRVSLRRRLPEGGLGDVLGELLSWDAVVRVQRRDGTVVEVAEADVVAAKRVPPPPERRR
ncbi:MAG: putative acetyltransferase [Mycobacteriales bacterium]